MTPTPLPEVLSGPRIALTAADPPRVDAASAMLADWPRFARFWPELPPGSATDAHHLAAQFDAMLRERRARFEEYAYELRAHTTSEFLGHASVHALMWKHGCAELAYWVQSGAEGQGYVAEAVRVLEQMLFGLGFQRVEIRCDVHNVPSAAVARRAGYALEGTLRAHMRRPDGSFRSSYVFAKLREDAERQVTDDATGK